jgi:hypothetical protein
LLARQASEQYSTSAQFLAQALRQVMVRPQTAQSLEGKACLLPLKSFFMGRLCPDGTFSNRQADFQGALNAIYLIAVNA